MKDALEFGFFVTLFVPPPDPVFQNMMPIVSFNTGQWIPFLQAVKAETRLSRLKKLNKKRKIFSLENCS